jgi:hypothetical protein
MYGGAYVYRYAILTSVMDVGDWSGSRHDRIIPEKEAQSTQWTGDWVDPWADVETAVKSEYLVLS